MIKTPERRHLRRSVAFIVNSVHISYGVLVFNFDHGCFPRFLKLYKCYQIAQNIYALFNICGSWNSPSHLFIEMFCYKSVIGKKICWIQQQCPVKRCSYKLRKIQRETTVDISFLMKLLAWDSDTGIFLWILRKIPECLF